MPPTGGQETVLIPVNRRDGSILAVNKGNPDWDDSPPYGAGQVMSRAKARQVLPPLEAYTASMQGIYTTPVNDNEQTLDEAPWSTSPWRTF